MVLFTGVQIVYVWFSIGILAWALPNTYNPQGEVSGKQRNVQESVQYAPQQDSWFHRQINYVPRRNDWPVVVEPSLQPWPRANDWN